MSDHDIELLKLQMQREQMRADLFKWFVAFVWPFIVNLGTAYIQHQAIENVANKADVAATKAEVVEATTKEIKTGVDASVKGWKAYQTKDPEDMNTAVEAVEKADKLTAVKQP